MRKSFRSEKFLALMLVLSLQICSARPVFKYLPHPGFAYIGILIGSFVFYYFLIQRLATGKKFLTPPFFTAILLLGIFTFSAFFYPKADALKTQGRGSDADDAVIVAASKLFAGKFPYDQPTYLGHPMSPGPGILVFMSPFALTNTYFLAIPFYSTLFILLCRKISRNFQIPALILLFLISSFGFLEYTIIGSDLVVISILTSIFIWLSLKWRDHTYYIAGLAIIFGLLMTARITMIYFIPVMAYILYRLNKSSGIIFGVLGFATCLLIHLGFNFWEPGLYAPLHLLKKGQGSTNMYIMVAGALFSVLLVYFLLKEKSFDTLNSLRYAWLFLAIPHLFIGIGMVITDRFILSNSEGPGYLIIQVFPFLLYCSFFLNSFSFRQNTRSQRITGELGEIDYLK